MGIFYVLLSYCTRIIWKKRLLHKMAEGGEHSLYIVTNYDLASKVIQNVKEHNYNRYNINGLILIDKDMTGKEIAGVQVVADLNNAPSFICQQWVDEVFVNVDETYPYPQELIEELLEMGMPVHVNLAKVRSTPGQKQFVEAIGGYTVLTTTMNYATDRQALAKRVLDILGGLVGCFLTGIIFIFIAPAIYISSPGPIFFSQTRIGKNGKPFKMYKFRSMYMDAEERKAELMAQNKMSDGRMFKLDFDPRVIGNKILPDGTRKTGIGEFIRKTSLDEFPQFWNVLNGSMSLVGTRPILQDELRQYELHHRARIAIKPGITGMWQVSGRSDITDFEEVVRLDTEYISNWNFSLDIKILFKTVIMVLKREGSIGQFIPRKGFAKASQGLADYLKKHFKEPSVAIGYDSRVKSDVFAKVAAGVFAANGVSVNIWPVLMPVPTVSFATRYLHTSAGVMVTASHNPGKYNGYKVYGADGCQITTEAAAEILAEIEKLDIFADVKTSNFEAGVANGSIRYIPDEVYTAFVEQVKSQSVLFGENVNKNVAIVYSPLNGTGLKSDVLKFLLEDNCSLVVRPSGTEPKLKIYISVSAENKEMAEKVEDEIAKTAEKWIC